MPTELEIRKEQKALLFRLLKLKQKNNIEVEELDEWIFETMTEMLEEDVALVEKNIGIMLNK